MATVIAELWTTIRAVIRRPALPLAIVGSMALGVGAVCAFVRVATEVALRPLSLPDSERLLAIGRRFPNTYQDGHTAAELLNGLQSLESVAVQGEDTQSRVRVDTQTRAVATTRVTTGYFDTLGVRIAQGRGFEAGDEQRASPVILLSHRFWSEVLGRPPEIVGRPLTIDGALGTVVGVLSPGGTETTTADLWLPLVVDRADRGRNYLIIGRLRPGVSVTAAQAELTSTATHLSSGMAGSAVILNAVPLHRALGLEVFPVLTMLTAGASLTAVVTLANVLLLTAVRACSQRAPTATRALVGASRGSMWRQVTLEYVVISLAGAACGSFVATALVRATHLYTDRLSRWAISDGFVWTTFLAAAPVAGTMILLAGKVSLPREDRISLAVDGRGATRRWNVHQSALLAVQSAVATALIVGALQLLGALLPIRADALGFRAERLSVIEYWEGGLSSASSRPPAAVTQDVLRVVESVKGVQGAAFSTSLPSRRSLKTAVSAENLNGDTSREWPVDVIIVTPGYFELMKIPQVSGRGIQRTDTLGGTPVIVLSEALASALARDSVPPGSPVVLVSPTGVRQRHEVIGVVGNVRSERLDDVGHLAVYVPLAQLRREDFAAAAGHVSASFVVLCESLCDPVSLEQAFALSRQGERPTAVRALSAVVASQLAKARMEGALIFVVAVLACLMAILGVYAVAALTTRERVREIGIRVALGAQPARLGRDLFYGVGRAVAAGTAVGLLGGMALTSVLRLAVTSVTVGQIGWLPYLPAAALVPSVAAMALLWSVRASLMSEPMRAIQRSQA